MALYAFDGTGDRWDRNFDTVTQIATVKNGRFPGRRYLTNIVLFLKEYKDSGMPVEYFSGVGSSGIGIDTVFGGAFGVGTRIIARRAFKKLKENFQEGDYDIDIVGYSRGAASARIFAHRIHRKYKQLRDQDDVRLKEAPKIRFIGLFDTVVSLGNPFNDNENSFIYPFDPQLPSNVEKAYHAMALDLNRRAFGLDRIESGNGVDFEQVWFRGGHGDIGGNATFKEGFGQGLPSSEFPEELGPPNRRRSNIALIYMFKKAMATGINLSSVDFDNYPINIRSPIIVSNTKLDRRAGSKPDPSRIPREGDLFHYSFFDDGSVIPSSQFTTLSGYEDDDPEEFAKRYVELPESIPSSQIELD